MLVSFKRIIKAGFLSLGRNFGLSLAEIVIITIVLFIFTFLFSFNKASQVLISKIQEKVDISVYFKIDAKSEDIFSVKAELMKMPEVKEAEYVSREDALNKFIERHKDEPTIIDSLKEVGDNPFFASLNVKASEGSQYEKIQQFLESSSYGNIINKIDYFQRKSVIEKIYLTTRNINKVGSVFGVVLIIVSILVAIYAIRIAIYNLREEIATMRLVGASNWFIRGPFLVQGFITGLISVFAAFFITFLICFLIDPQIRLITSEIGALNLFWTNFWNLLLLQLAVGLALGVISSYIGVRRYLKI